MNRLILYLVLVAFFSSCNSENKPKVSNSNYNIATYNIRYAKDLYFGEHSWRIRKPELVKMFNRLAPDIVGLQEVLLVQLDYLKKILPNYKFVGVAREDGKFKGEFCPIFYNKERFKLLDSGTFWLSETPNEPGSMSWKTACTRICTWAKLQDIKTEKSLMFYNTHLDHVSALARVNGVKLIVQHIAENNTENLPTILVGDFNSLTSSQTIKGVRDAGFSDCFTKQSKITERPPTFSNFGKYKKGPHIDYIFIKNDLSVISYQVHDYTDFSTDPSDHFPVKVELKR